MSCLFVHDFRSYSRNGEVYTSNLSYEILEKRYIKYFDSIKILNRAGVMKELDRPEQFVKASGPNIEFLNAINIFTPLSFAKNYFKYKNIVCNYVDVSEYIIIRLDSFLGLIAAHRCRKTSRKYLVEVVGCVWDSFWNKGLFGKLVALPLFLKMKREVKAAPFVVYVTNSFLQKRYPTNGFNTNISNVNIAKRDDRILTNRIDRIENSVENNLQLVTTASVSVKYKGQDSVIKALGELKRRGYNNFVYHLIGGGDQSYLKHIAKKEGVEKQIVFHGEMNHNKVMASLDQCDIYIQPSKQEGLPRSLIEGMSRGLVCMGTCIAGIPELLEPKMLFSKKKNNYIEIANLIEKIDKFTMIEQAERNISKSQQFESDLLERKREHFFLQYKESIQ